MYRMECIAGVDEVGRGPLAGAVYAAAVVLDPTRPVTGLKDSKKLSEKKRDALNIVIQENAMAFSIAVATVEEIDRINILHASLLAMQRAVAGLNVPLDFVFVDGNRVPQLNTPAAWLIKGDDRFDAIKAASIVAKVARDTEMRRLDECYPGYGLSQHKGYPTKAHVAALNALGPSPIHRMSFAPCRAAQVMIRSKSAV